MLNLVKSLCAVETRADLPPLHAAARPLAVLDAEPTLRAAFARAWRGASAEFRAYKRLALYDDLVESFLRGRGE